MHIYTRALVAMLLVLNIFSVPALAAYTPSTCQPVDTQVGALPCFSLHVVEQQPHAALPKHNSSITDKVRRMHKRHVVAAVVHQEVIKQRISVRHHLPNHRSTDQAWFQLQSHAFELLRQGRFLLNYCFHTAADQSGLIAVSQQAHTYGDAAAASFKDMCMSKISKVTTMLTPTT